MTRIPSPGTEAFYAYVMDQLEELESLQFNFPRAKTPAEIDSLKTEMLKVVANLDKTSSRWAREDLKEIYSTAYRSSGARAAIPKAASARNLRSRKQAQEGFRRASGDIRRWVDDHSNEARVGKARTLFQSQLRKAEDAARRGDKEALKQVGQIKDQMSKLPEFRDIPDEPTVFYRDRKGKVIARRSARQYYDMAIQSAYSRANNLGIVEGAADTAYFIVSDGPDCGWLDHNDGQKMNGEVVSKKVAQKAPLSHPYCQRTFTLADGPPGSRKLQKQLKSLTGTAQRRVLQRLAQAGPVIDRGYDNFRTIMRVISVAKNSNITRMLIRQIELDNPGTLPAFATRGLRQWENEWANKEELYIRRMGSFVGDAPHQDHSFYAIEHLNQSLGPEILKKYGWVDDVDVSPDLRTLLGYSPREAARKGELVSRMEDYADFVAHRRAGQMIQPERLLDNTLMAESRQFTVAAMKMPFGAPRGFGMKSAKKIAHSYESAVRLAASDPERLGFEVVKELAGNLDVLPWWRSNLGPVKFGIGMTADGRRRLAGQLYKNMRSARMWSNEDLTWAKSIGLHLNDSLKLEDVVKALQPRVSYLGKSMYYTVGLENGRLAPIIRVHPPYAVLRHLGLEVNLAKRFSSGVRFTPQQYLEALRGDYAKGGPLEVLRNMTQESLYTVSVFKDSPVYANLHLTGRHLDNWAIHTATDDKWIGSVGRLYGRPAVEMTEERRTEIYRALVDRGLSREQALKVLHLAELPSRYEDRIFGTPLDAAKRTLQARLREGMREDSQEFLGWTRRIAKLEADQARQETRNIISELLKQATRFEDRVWTPRFDSLPATSWSIEPGAMRTLAKMYAWQGDLLEVGRMVGISYADVVRAYHRAPDLFENALRGFRSKMGIESSAAMSLSDLRTHPLLRIIHGIIPDDLPGVKASAEFWIAKAKATREWAMLPLSEKKIILKVEMEILKKNVQRQVQHLQRRWETYWKLRRTTPSYFAAFDDFLPDEDSFRDNYLNSLLERKGSDDYLNRMAVQPDFQDYKWNPNGIAGFNNDVDDFYNAWAKMFGPNLDKDQVPFISVGDGPRLTYSKNNWTPGVTAYNAEGDNFIYIHHTAVHLWDEDFRVFMKSAHASGQFSQGETRNLLWHEVGHWLSNEISDNLTKRAKEALDFVNKPFSVSEDYQDMWAKILRELDPSLSRYSDQELRKAIFLGEHDSYEAAFQAKAMSSQGQMFIREVGYVEERAWKHIMDLGLRDKISTNVSVYGASSPKEMIAELFSQYMTDSNPSPLARIVGESLVEGFKRKNNL